MLCVQYKLIHVADPRTSGSSTPKSPKFGGGGGSGEKSPSSFPAAMHQLISFVQRTAIGIPGAASSTNGNENGNGSGSPPAGALVYTQRVNLVNLRRLPTDVPQFASPPLPIVLHAKSNSLVDQRPITYARPTPTLYIWLAFFGK